MRCSPDRCQHSERTFGCPLEETKRKICFLLTARDFFLANFYPLAPFACNSFLQNLCRVFSSEQWLTPVPRSSLQTTGTGSCVECPRDINKLNNMEYCVYGLVFRSTEYGFDFPREIGVFYGIWGLLRCTGFFAKYFNRELLCKKKKRDFCGLMTCRLND